MKKILFLFTLLVFFTGCSIKDINDYDINGVIEDAISTRDNITNIVANGYKFYLPRGIKLVDKNDYNSKLLSNDTYYYLYVDVISYYHKSPIDYVVNNELYFSKEISYYGKEGYVEISKDEEKYFLKIFYNYAKIESYVDEENLNEALYNSIKILASIEYNDKVLSTTIGENVLDYQEEVYDFFDSKREEGNFLDYIEEYDVYDDSNENVKDEDVLDSDN